MYTLYFVLFFSLQKLLKIIITSIDTAHTYMVRKTTHVKSMDLTLAQSKTKYKGSLDG